MNISRRAKRVSSFQAEQLKLVKIQAEVERILGKVNESINALKVEELQLKSSAVASMQRQMKPIPAAITSNEIPATSLSSLKIERNDGLSKEFDIHEIDSEVNKQEIDLDMFVRPIKRNLMEEEEEEEESD